MQRLSTVETAPKYSLQTTKKFLHCVTAQPGNSTGVVHLIMINKRCLVEWVPMVMWIKQVHYVHSLNWCFHYQTFYVPRFHSVSDSKDES